MAWWRSWVNRVVFAVPLPALVACSSLSAPDYIGIQDGGSGYSFDATTPLPDASILDDASGACAPANVQGYIPPSWTQPKEPVSACTLAELTAYGDCLDAVGPVSPACLAWTDAGADASVTGACRACVADSKASDTAWGPIVDVGTSGSDRQLNFSGCLAIALHDTGGGCPGSYQALQECEAAACADDCEGASVGALEACNKAADLGGCTNYVGPAACTADAGSGAAACFAPAGATFGQQFVAVARVFCLEVDEDAGGLPLPDAAIASDSTTSYEGGGGSAPDASAGTGDAADEGDGE